MGKGVKLVFASLLCAGVAIIAWLVFWPLEPVYQGKRLSRWLDEAFWSAGPSTQTTTAIGSMGTNALPTLLRMVQARDGAFQRAMVAFSRRPSRVLAHVHSAHDYHVMATWGFEALGPKAKPAMPALVRLLNDSDVDVRSSAADCLAVIGPSGEATVTALMQCLSNAISSRSGSHETDFLKERAATVLGIIGSGAERSIPILTVLTNDGIWYVRNAAMGSLMRIRGESVVPLIERLRDTSDPIKWYEAAMLISDFGTNAEPAIPLLISALGSGNDIILGHGALALGKIHRQPEVCVPALIPLLGSSSVSTRQKSLIALGQFGAAATSAVPAIRHCLNDSDPWVRMRAPMVLKDLDSGAALEAGIK